MAKGTKPTDADVVKTPHKGKKLLLIFISLLLLLALIGGAFAVWLFAGHANANGDEEYAEETVKEKPARKKEPGELPAFVNLDTFTVNLASEGGDQYLQVVLSLELDDKASEPMLKTLMPRIRNNIMLLLSSKKASELQSKEGKEELALALRNEINRAIDPAARPDKKGIVDGPVENVLFTSFIIQ
ncbi:MAG: flagellar basal body-associated FliL family protein [Azonexus sp.]|jgi:flagellar FliL protein|nr:flagellar basal body-associated FliL family protein [Azonexus sp.]